MSAGKGRRPLMVTVLAVLFLLSGLLSVASGVAALFGLSIFGQPEVGLAAGGTAVLTGIVSLVVSLGFRNGWGFMWVIGLVVTGLQVIGGFLGLLSGNFGVFLSLLVEVVILFYLLKPNVRKFFLG